MESGKEKWKRREVMRIYKANRWLSVLLLAGALLLTADVAHATRFTWTGAVSTDWFTPRNWRPVGVPGANDAAIIGRNKVFDVLAAVTVRNLSID